MQSAMGHSSTLLYLPAATCSCPRHWQFHTVWSWLLPASCIHAPSVLCTPLADRPPSFPARETSSPSGHSPSGEGRELCQTPRPDTDLPDSTAPLFSHEESSNSTGLDCRGLGRLTHCLHCEHCHTQVVRSSHAASPAKPCSTHHVTVMLGKGSFAALITQSVCSLPVTN